MLPEICEKLLGRKLKVLVMRKKRDSNSPVENDKLNDSSCDIHRLQRTRSILKRKLTYAAQKKNTTKHKVQDSSDSETMPTGVLRRRHSMADTQSCSRIYSCPVIDLPPIPGCSYNSSELYSRDFNQRESTPTRRASMSSVRGSLNNSLREQSTRLVKTIKLDNMVKCKWISGMAVTKKNEIVLVDTREAYVIDDGKLKRKIGNKGNGKLIEPVDIAVLKNGNIAISDHADQSVKLFNVKGHFLRQILVDGLTNIACIAAMENGHLAVTAPDQQMVMIHSEVNEPLATIPAEDSENNSPFEHPYSLAVNPLTGDIIVGDDHKQCVTSVSLDGQVLWTFVPRGRFERPFFPSSISVDSEGYVFIADLYNERVYMLDSSGRWLRTVLSNGDGLRGGPGVISTDSKGNLLVSDEERTIKVFSYGRNGFTVNKRFSYCPGAN